MLPVLLGPSRQPCCPKVNSRANFHKLTFSSDTYISFIHLANDTKASPRNRHMMDTLTPSTLYTTDDATASLILQLQHEDLEALNASTNGEGRVNEVSDADLAICMLNEDLQKMSDVLSDRRMGRSLASAVITDAPLLLEAATEEDLSAHDRMIAERLLRGDETGLLAIRDRPENPADDLLIARLTALYVSDASDETSMLAASGEDEASDESLQLASLTSNPSQSIQYECVSCTEFKRDFEILQTPCGHHYCQVCLSALFDQSTKDETLFPPRCCREIITLDSARLYVSTALAQNFSEKSLEFGSPDRTYCSQPTCASFIPPASISSETSTATCILCHTSTCTICKGTSHDDDCPEDVGMQLILGVAREQGWQRCYNCRRFVELNTGCNHIT